MEWKFLFNPGQSDELEIEEPIGFDGIELSVIRDEKLHGIGYEASTSALKFYGAAAETLRTAKKLYNVKANVILQVLNRCEGETDYEEVLNGRLNFGKYKESCGSQCLVSIPWEESSCALTLKAKYDQKVDIDKTTASDNATPLQDYAGLSVAIDLPARELLAAIDGSVSEEKDIIDYDLPRSTTIFRPTYTIERYNNIATGQLTPFNNYYNLFQNGLCISPQFLYEDNISCFSGTFAYHTRTKGRFRLSTNEVGVLYVRLQMRLWDGTGTICAISNNMADNIEWDDIAYTIEDGFMVGEFDIEQQGNVVVPEGQGLYLFIQTQFGSNTSNFPVHVEFDPETFFTIEANKNCPTTSSTTYLVHELLSRLTENITNGCMRVKSSYYGRTDSEPFAFDTDGCGGLRALTSGLYLRKAPEANFFLSLKDAIEGLNPIDNIGIGIEADTTIPGRYLLRVEDVGFFYQDNEIFVATAIPDADIDTEETKNYSVIKVGYKEWQPEAINGLDEINSTREYRTTIDTVTNTLDITSEIITGSYLIETTRQQSFANTGGADTSQDSAIFLVTLARTIYGYIAEKGGITNPANIYSPDTVFNYRLSPLRNLMRWYRTILSAFPQLNTDAQLFFNSGEANILASGEQTDALCKIENGVITENQTLSVANFSDAAAYTPIWKNDTVSFDYPLSVKEYKQIKAAPYGYVRFQCGTGPFDKGWLKELKYKPGQGVATFVLRKKYTV